MWTILVFAHVPPPHHGQSYMVAQLLEELRARPDEVRVFHVDSRVSNGLEDVGKVGAGKVLQILRHCAKACWLRLRHGPMVFYYVPAPAKRGALYRDWLVMALCRPFFRRRVVLHWHAVGLGEWLTRQADRVTALVTRLLLGRPHLSLILAQTVSEDAAVFRAEQTRVLANGIPDPCPDFEANVLPARRRRATDGYPTFRVLFLAHCTREKGVYDALEGVFNAQERLVQSKVNTRLTLTVAGEFPSVVHRVAFDEAVARLTAAWSHGEASLPAVECVGFAGPAEKRTLFRESDCFCFPSFYPNEVMPVVLIEALAHGLPIVTTRWRAIPSMLPAAGCWLVEPHHSEEVGQALQAALRATDFALLRAHFLGNFRRDVFGQRFCELVAELFA